MSSMLVQREKRPLHLNARGAILDRIDRAVESGILEWQDNDAYAWLMSILLPEDFSAPGRPLVPAKRGLAVVIRGQQ